MFRALLSLFSPAPAEPSYASVRVVRLSRNGRGNW